MLLIRVAIVENEEYYKVQLEKALRLWAQEDCLCEIEAACFTSGEDFLEEQIDSFHIVFMDIELDGQLNGMETAKVIRTRGSRLPIAFLTVHDVFVFKGYEVNAMAYCLKPISFEKVKSCMDRLHGQISNSKYIYSVNNQIVSIPYSEIIYCQSALHYTDIITKNKRFSHKITLNQMERRLTGQFVRCHRTTVVNIMHVNEMRGREFLMSDGEWLTVSKRYLDIVKSVYLDWPGN